MYAMRMGVDLTFLTDTTVGSPGTDRRALGDELESIVGRWCVTSQKRLTEIACELEKGQWFALGVCMDADLHVFLFTPQRYEIYIPDPLVDEEESEKYCPPLDGLIPYFKGSSVDYIAQATADDVPVELATKRWDDWKKFWDSFVAAVDVPHMRSWLALKYFVCSDIIEP